MIYHLFQIMGQSLNECSLFDGLGYEYVFTRGLQVVSRWESDTG